MARKGLVRGRASSSGSAASWRQRGLRRAGASSSASATAACYERPMMPDAWRRILEREFPYFRKLAAEQRTKLLADAEVFATKDFVGIDGFVVDDRARLHVSATAALL